MTLRSHLIRYFKEHGTELGVDMQHKKFQIGSRGGFASPAYIDRELRNLANEGRLTRKHPNGLVEFTYNPSKYEQFHERQMQM